MPINWIVFVSRHLILRKVFECVFDSWPVCLLKKLATAFHVIIICCLLPAITRWTYIYSPYIPCRSLYAIHVESRRIIIIIIVNKFYWSVYRPNKSHCCRFWLTVYTYDSVWYTTKQYSARNTPPPPQLHWLNINTCSFIIDNLSHAGLA